MSPYGPQDRVQNLKVAPGDYKSWPLSTPLVSSLSTSHRLYILTGWSAFHCPGLLCFLWTTRRWFLCLEVSSLLSLSASVIVLPGLSLDIVSSSKDSLIPKTGLGPLFCGLLPYCTCPSHYFPSCELQLFDFWPVSATRRTWQRGKNNLRLLHACSSGISYKTWLRVVSQNIFVDWWDTLSSQLK